jgi:hypothetical protein
MTAVEWLFQLSKQRELDKFDLEQAKEMEKQQIIDAFEEGSSDGYDGWGSTNKEKYYNEISN